MANQVNKIYVGNLPFSATEQDLEDAFKPAEGTGEIKEIALIRDRFSNESKGFGFITFTTDAATQNALLMNGKDFMGRALKVSLAREQVRRSSGEGGGRRFGGGERRRNRW